MKKIVLQNWMLLATCLMLLASTQAGAQLDSASKGKVYSIGQRYGQFLAADSEIYNIKVTSKDTVYVVGKFKNASNNLYVAKWNGNTWEELGGPNSFKALLGSNYAQRDISSIYVDDIYGDVYVTGKFKNARGYSFVGYYSNTKGWTELGGLNSLPNSGALGLNDPDYNYPINAVTYEDAGLFGRNPVIFVGGGFYNSSGKRFVAFYNFSDGTWRPLNSGYPNTNELNANSVINTLTISNSGILYAGGYFTTADGYVYVGKFDFLHGWSILGGGNSLNSSTKGWGIFSIAVDKDENVYAAGDFKNTHGTPCVMKCDTAGTWSELGGFYAGLAPNNRINSIAVDSRGFVYAAGYFTNSYNRYYVAKWNKNNWSELGGGYPLYNGSTKPFSSLAVDAKDNIFFNNAIPHSWFSTYYTHEVGVFTTGKTATKTTYATICAADAPYNWEGTLYYNGNNQDITSTKNVPYTKNLITTNQYDSIVALYLTVSSSTLKIWKGNVDSNWNNGSNWCDGNVPGSSDSVLIPVSSYFPPVLPVDGFMNVISNPISVQEGASIKLAKNSFHSFLANIKCYGSIIADPTSSMYFRHPGNFNTSDYSFLTFGVKNTDSLLSRLGVYDGAWVIVNNGLGIVKSLEVNNSYLTNQGRLTLKSSSAGTAILYPVTLNYSIQGNGVTVEHYIPKGLKTYHLLSVGGVYYANIFNNWQEGGRNTAGYGAYVTGNYATSQGYNATTGLDNSINGYRNMFKYISQTVGDDIINSKTTNFDPFTGYALFLHGDRAGNLLNSKFFYGDSMNSGTVLRATGQLIYGAVTYTTSGVTNALFSSSVSKLASDANKESMVANPYAGILDWESVGLTGITNTYYYADPTLVTSGLPTTVSYNSTSHTNSNPSKSTINQYIQPGQAFFVVNDATNNSRQLVMNQSSYSGSRLASTGGVLKPTNPLNRIAISLWKNDENIDGAVAIFNNGFKKEYGNEDSRKLHSSNGNIWITDAGNELSIDGLPEPTGTEAIAINLGNLEAGNLYKLVVNTTEFASNNLTAYWVDNLLHTTTALQSGENTIAIQPIAQSTGRYSIAFKKTGLPIAENTNKGINVYPNPVKGNSFNLSLNEVAKGSYALSLYNALGKVVFTKSIQTDGNASIQTVALDANLTNGIYSLQLKGENGQYETKVMVQ